MVDKQYYDAGPQYYYVTNIFAGSVRALAYTATKTRLTYVTAEQTNS